ncbi:hypothetical protein SALBM135S_04403 [Streptomyces alboniger]
MTPLTTRPKKGSANTRAVKAFCADSVLSPAPETTRATVSALRVTRERAARLGAYPVRSMAARTTSWRAGSTLRTPLTTLETVARETPATRATSSRVGSSWLMREP